MRKLRIGQIAPLNVPIPPPKYGGTERIIDALCRGLTERGHEVFLFSSGEAKTKANIIPIIAKSLWRNDIKDTTPYYSYEMAVINREAKRLNLNILHDHLGPFTLSLYNATNIPIVHTLHVPINISRAWAYQMLNSKLISISNNQRKDAPKLNYIATIYNSTDTNLFGFLPKAKDYCLFLGELVERKGVLEAVKIAKQLKLKLIIAGRVPLETPSQLNDHIFFTKFIKPELNRGNIEYFGEATSKQAAKLYGEAKICLFPIKWEEPFGLVMIESMACGTPVVAFSMGSVPEIIKDGKTGFIINISSKDKRGNWITKKTGAEGMAEAVKKIYAMPDNEYRKMREDCRGHVEENFSVEKMVDGYEKAYQKVIEKDNL